MSKLCILISVSHLLPLKAIPVRGRTDSPLIKDVCHLQGWPPEPVALPKQSKMRTFWTGTEVMSGPSGQTAP